MARFVLSLPLLGRAKLPFEVMLGVSNAGSAPAHLERGACVSYFDFPLRTWFTVHSAIFSLASRLPISRDANRLSCRIFVSIAAL